jgi:HEAT repeat protein
MQLLRTSVALLALASFAFAQAQDEVEERPRFERWVGPLSEGEQAAAEILRESRRAQDDETRAKLGQRLWAVGKTDVNALLEILVRARVPETTETDSMQILSEPQREMVLAALAALPPERIRPLIKTRLEETNTDAVRLAAVHLLGAIGAPSDVAECCKLTPRDGEGRPTDVGHDALCTAITSILQRDGDAWKVIPDVLRSQRPEVQSALLTAVADAGGVRAFEVLFNAARGSRQLEEQAVSQLRSVCEDVGAEDRRECSSWLASQLRHGRAEYVRTMLQTIGVLDDGTHVPQLLEYLVDENPNTREAAGWALRKITGASYPTDSVLWKTWYAQEQRWMLRERPKLCDSLSSSDRSKVAAALKQYSERRTFRDDLALDLLPLLKRPEQDVVVRTCEVLARLDSPLAVESMLPLIDSVNPRILAAARTSLESITGRTLPASSEDAYAALYPR